MPMQPKVFKSSNAAYYHFVTTVRYRWMTIMRCTKGEGENSITSTTWFQSLVLDGILRRGIHVFEDSGY